MAAIKKRADRMGFIRTVTDLPNREEVKFLEAPSSVNASYLISPSRRRPDVAPTKNSTRDNDDDSDDADLSPASKRRKERQKRLAAIDAMGEEEEGEDSPITKRRKEREKRREERLKRKEAGLLGDDDLLLDSGPLTLAVGQRRLEQSDRLATTGSLSSYSHREYTRKYGD